MPPHAGAVRKFDGRARGWRSHWNGDGCAGATPPGDPRADAEHPVTREGDLIDQRFRIGRAAGEGGMGIVHVARDERTGESVAVKFLTATDPTDVARFDREADLLVALQHPGVVRYVAHGRTAHGAPWLAMEWLAGETLKDRSRRAPLTPAEVIAVGCALASALAGAHAQGIVHRDVKPANVHLSSGEVGAVKLLDFGVARLRRWNGKTAAQLTLAGASVGTPAYMSPEQARGDDDVGAPSDVFSLGVVLFELAAGERPFQADDIIDFMLQLTRERAPSVAPRATHFPVRFAETVDAMLDPDPAKRPSMAEVSARLGRLRNALSPGAPKLAVLAQANSTMVGPDPRATPPATSAPPAVVSTPTVLATPRASGRRPNMFLFAGGVTILVGVGLAVALVATRAGPTATTSANAKPADTPANVRSVSTSTSSSLGSARAVPAPPSAAPDPSALACPSTAWSRCDPPPPGAPSAVDPSDLVAACLSTARKLDPKARLLSVRGSGLRDGKVDLAEPGSCGVVREDMRYMPIQVNAQMVGAMFIEDPMVLNASSANDVPDAPCPFEKAWAIARPLLGGERAGVEYSPCADTKNPELIPCWQLLSERHLIHIDARSCELSTSIDPR